MCITAVWGVAEPAGDGAWCSWRPRERSNGGWAVRWLFDLSRGRLEWHFRFPDGFASCRSLHRRLCTLDGFAAPWHGFRHTSYVAVSPFPTVSLPAGRSTAGYAHWTAPPPLGTDFGTPPMWQFRLPDGFASCRSLHRRLCTLDGSAALSTGLGTPTYKTKKIVRFCFFRRHNMSSLLSFHYIWKKYKG